MSAAVLTSDMQYWLVLLLIAVVAAAYGACGVLSAIGRARVRRRERRGGMTPARARARQEVTS